MMHILQELTAVGQIFSYFLVSDVTILLLSDSCTPVSPVFVKDSTYFLWPLMNLVIHWGSLTPMIKQL